jgi:hypothetical protein
MLREWTISKLEAVRDGSRVLVRDPLRLLPEADGAIHIFARENGFTVIVASTNLVFRELYERAIADKEVKKILVIDRAPLRRRVGQSISKAPPPFYPDFLSKTPLENRIELELRQFLRETSGDPNWPSDANDPQYARLISSNMDSVIRAHSNLRNSDPDRFTDHDFQTIVAFAALGVAESAFKKLDAQDYWKIGLMAHETLEELGSLAPDVTKPILKEIRKAPAPFRWFAEHDAELVIRAFYLSVLLAQHIKHWKLLLGNIDPSLGPLSNIDPEILFESAPKLIDMDPRQADRDLQSVEDSLDRDAIQFLLLEQFNLSDPDGFISLIEQENYSTLFRSLALLMALDNLLSEKTNLDGHNIILKILFREDKGEKARFVDIRSSVSCSHLKEAYELASDVRQLREKLSGAIKTLKVVKTEKLTFKYFRDLWNNEKINRLEYFLSALLPRADNELPSFFVNILAKIRQRIQDIIEEVHRQLDEINHRFQEMIASHYPEWIKKDEEVILTSQFVRRCLKYYWDPEKEKAVVFIFDGMRYDIWDEFIRPMFEDRMEIIKDYPASSLLPSETYITRKAICAGTYPDSFDTNAGEDKLLKSALKDEFGYKGKVDVVPPEGLGVGETVRYQAENLDVYIFELCDKELHKIQIKTLPDGRQVPSRPLAFIYQQHLKNIIDTEVMAIIRSLSPGTKVFVTADHGFGRVGREPLWFDETDLNETVDCRYLNCWLRSPVDQVRVPKKVRDNIISFSPEELRMPSEEKRTIKKTGQVFHKEYKSIVFPKIGHSFSRKSTHYNPDAYSHGGISIQEMMIPMVVLKVKSQEEGLILLSEISGPSEAVEGEKIEFRLTLSRAEKDKAASEEIRVDVSATYSVEPDERPLSNQVLYVPFKGIDIVYRFQPDPQDAIDDERKEGMMQRTFTVTVSYKEGLRTHRKSRTHKFAVRLNPDQIVRRVPKHLGNILGLTPKSMR